MAEQRARLSDAVLPAWLSRHGPVPARLRGDAALDMPSRRLDRKAQGTEYLPDKEDIVGWAACGAARRHSGSAGKQAQPK
ncbi:hypothetical protein NDU88_004475 [Pleurodeles waltl]|uniref:Uncharacterized protein n=1 Tax=Pleurodeles waltl TaxID=8319 RepID=A0AAV7VJ25_PLEWA|nr:hypothetical protein NDU88_004475 [Pleurodeles waltl]